MYDMKWYAIAMIGMFLAMFGSLAVEEYTKAKGLAECRTAAIQKGMSAEDINKLCK